MQRFQNKYQHTFAAFNDSLNFICNIFFCICFVFLFSNRIIYLIEFVSVLVLHVPVALEDVFLGLRPNYYLLHLCISAKCLNIIHFLCVFPSLPPNLSHRVLLGRSIQKTQHIFSDSYAPRRSRLMFVQGTCSGTGGHTPAAVPPYRCRGRCLPSALHLGRPT